MSEIKESFEKRFADEVAAWKAEDQERRKEIEDLEQRIKDYDERIRRDLDSPEGATASTAAAQMNRDHAQSLVDSLRKEIAEHKPLYDFDGYDRVCSEIQGEYDEIANEKLSAFDDKLSEALRILDDLSDLFHEAGECQKSLNRACGETGTDIRKHNERKNLYIDVRGYRKEIDARKILNDLRYRLRQ